MGSFKSERGGGATSGFLARHESAAGINQDYASTMPGNLDRLDINDRSIRNMGSGNNMG